MSDTHLLALIGAALALIGVAAVLGHRRLRERQRADHEAARREEAKRWAAAAALRRQADDEAAKYRSKVLDGDRAFTRRLMAESPALDREAVLTLAWDCLDDPAVHPARGDAATAYIDAYLDGIAIDAFRERYSAVAAGQHGDAARAQRTGETATALAEAYRTDRFRRFADERAAETADAEA